MDSRLSEELKSKFIFFVDVILSDWNNFSTNKYLTIMNEYYSCSNYADIGSWLLNNKYNKGNNFDLLLRNHDLLREGALILAEDIIAHTKAIESK
jgi:hypothetical protein